MGIPATRLQGTVTGVRAFVFLELVDVAPDSTRTTINDQVMPVALDGGPVDRRIDLHGIAWRLEPGHVLQPELTTGSTQYASPRSGPFAVSLTATVDLPVSPG